MDGTGILVAAATATLKHNGQRFYLVANQTLVHADDPIVEGHEGLFRPLQVEYLGDAPAGRASAPVEQATAAPGEKRTVSRGRAKRSAGEPDKGKG